MWSQVGLRKHYCEQACGGDRISAELFKILRDNVVKMLHSTQQWPQAWKKSVFILIPKKGIAKDSSIYYTVTLTSHAINSKIMSRKQQHNPIFLPEDSHRQRSLTGYSTWGHKQSDMTKRLSICLKSFKFSFSSMWTENFQMYKLGLEKAEAPRDQIANIHRIMEKGRKFQKNIYFCFIDHYKKTWLCGSQETVGDTLQ